MSIRAITFDLDDTLWDNRPVLVAAEQELHAWLARHYPRLTATYDIDALRAQRHALAARDPELRYRMTALRKESLRLAAEASGYDGTLVEPAFEVFLAARHRITLFDDVVPTLRALRARGYRLGSITNGNADVDRLGLRPLFDFSVTAEGVGAPKPDPRIFAAACAAAGAGPEALVHVGDEPETDVAGASAAGVRVVWMNRSGQRWPGGRPPDAEVRGMTEVLFTLAAWTTGPG